MNIENKTLYDFINKWIDYREEDISVLNFDDKKHLICFDKHSKNILKNVPEINKKFVNKELFKLDSEFADYASYWNRKYYKNGFQDAIKLFLFGIDKTN